ncbi:hypothetical protein R1flu_021794 [Riccia fluitans]|uniref:Uncharacterized protein n=1 Tax=Riccia fluitans TaxID=41844 RepID=A0ABD1ZS62_9MARC
MQNAVRDGGTLSCNDRGPQEDEPARRGATECLCKHWQADQGLSLNMQIEQLGRNMGKAESRIRILTEWTPNQSREQRALERAGVAGENITNANGTCEANCERAKGQITHERR